MILANEPYTDQLYLQKSNFVSLYFRLLWYHSILKGSIDQKHAKTNEIWRQNSEIDSPFAWSHWLLLASMISRSFQTVKPGSHIMPRSYLRHSCRCCLRHRSDMRTEVAGNRSHVSLYRQHACEVDSSSNLAGMPAVKTAMFPVAGDIMSSYVGEVSQAVPTAMSQVLRRHMRTRLKAHAWSVEAENTIMFGHSLFRPSRQSNIPTLG